MRAGGEGAALAANAGAAAAADHSVASGDGAADARTIPWRWSIYRWLEGETATRSSASPTSPVRDRPCRVPVALQRIDAAGGPPPGRTTSSAAGRWRLRPRDPASDCHARRQDRWRTRRRQCGRRRWQRLARRAGLGPRRRRRGNLLVKGGSSAPSSTSGAAPSAIRPAIWPSPGRSDRRKPRAFRAALAARRRDLGARARLDAVEDAEIVHAGLPGAYVLEAEKSRRVIEEILADHQRAQRQTTTT